MQNNYYEQSVFFHFIYIIYIYIYFQKCLSILMVFTNAY